MARIRGVLLAGLLLMATAALADSPRDIAPPTTATDEPSQAGLEALRTELRAELGALAASAHEPLASEQRTVLAGFVSAVELALIRPSLAADAEDMGRAPLPSTEAIEWVSTRELDRWRDERDAIALQVDALRAAIRSLAEQAETDSMEIRRHRSDERLWSERARHPTGSSEPRLLDAQAQLARWRARAAEFVWQQAVRARREAESTLPTLEARLEELQQLSNWAASRQRLSEGELAEALAQVEDAVADAAHALSTLDAENRASGGQNSALLAALAAEAERLAVLRGQADVWRLRAKVVVALADARADTAALRRVLVDALGQLHSRRRWAEGQLAYAEARDPEGIEAQSRRQLVAALGRSLTLLQRSLDDLDTTIDRGRPLWRKAADSALVVLRGIWEWELFVVTDRQQIDGREVVQDYGVTVGKTLGVILLLLLGYVSVGWITHLLRDSWLPKAGVERRRARTIARWVSGLLLLLVVLVVLKLARIPLVAFAFLGGALAIGIGFGAQTLLKNVMSGALILLERRVRVGDVLTVAGASGVCTDIGLRSSTVAGFDGIEVIVPNAVLLESTVNNWTGASTLVRREVSMVVPCDGREAESAGIVAACAGDTAGVLAEPAPKVLATRFVDGGMELTLQFWVALGTAPSPPEIESALRFAICSRLFDRGIAVLPPARVTLVPWSTAAPAAAGGPAAAD